MPADDQVVAVETQPQGLADQDFLADAVGDEIVEFRRAGEALPLRFPAEAELLDVAKVAVFFVDDRQVVRPGEIGSVVYIRDAAEDAGCRLFEYELEAQFRCAGSEGFVNWVENTLESPAPRACCGTRRIRSSSGSCRRRTTLRRPSGQGRPSGTARA